MNMKYQYNAALKATNSWLEVARPATQQKAVIRTVQVKGRELMCLMPSKKLFTTHPLTHDVKNWDAEWFGQYE